MKTTSHGGSNLRLGKEVCLCGNRAIKFKLSSWVCERCNRIEEMNLMKDGLIIKHKTKYKFHKGMYLGEKEDE